MSRMIIIVPADFCLSTFRQVKDAAEIKFADALLVNLLPTGYISAVFAGDYAEGSACFLTFLQNLSKLAV